MNINYIRFDVIKLADKILISFVDIILRIAFGLFKITDLKNGINF